MQPHPQPALGPRWEVAQRPVPYPEAVARMEMQVAAIHAGTERELVWLLEHPPLYTAGTSARAEDLVTPDLLPVFKTGRGGQFTYHGPGQRVGYVMLDLKQRGSDVRRFVGDLEEWLIRTLDAFGVKGERRSDRIGVWVTRSGGREDKIAALGVRVRRWITFHGVSLNVGPNLAHYAGIVPCGISQHGVTSLKDLGIDVPMAQVDQAMRESFDDVFGAVPARASAAG
jgi:lipoyl(octanoyl) transferase